MASAFSFAIDRGGTFTDVFCVLPGKSHVEQTQLPRPPRPSIITSISHTYTHTLIIEGKGYRVLKLLSEDPANYPDAPREVRKGEEGRTSQAGESAGRRACTSRQYPRRQARLLFLLILPLSKS